jgi:HSP20 family protein
MARLVPRSSGQLAASPTYRNDPSREMAELHDRLGQLVNGLFDGSSQMNGTGRAPIWAVPADISETDDAYIVELDLPNVKREDVNLELRDNELRVTGQIKPREREGILRRRARPEGEFEYLVVLPGEVDPNKVDATLSDGVLTVRLGKSATSQPRQIEVKGS